MLKIHKHNEQWFWLINSMIIIATLALGLRPKQRLTRVRAKRKTRESHFMPSGAQKNVREWTLTLPKELPLWELESRWTLGFSKNNCRDHNSLDWNVPYIIGKFLKLKCLKWACMTHSNIWNTSCGQEKGQKSNWQFDSRPLKVGNRLGVLSGRWSATYHWKALNESYNLVLDLISIGGLQRKLWAPTIVGIPSLRISKLPLGNPETKCHLDVAFVERHRVYYKGEGGGFPQVWAMVNLVNSNLLVACPNTKNAQTMH